MLRDHSSLAVTGYKSLTSLLLVLTSTPKKSESKEKMDSKSQQSTDSHRGKNESSAATEDVHS